MGELIQFIKGFFEENPDDILKEIEEEKISIKESKKRLSEISNKGIVNKFLGDDPEELKESIKESEQIIINLQKSLKAISLKETKKKKKEKKPRKFNKVLFFLIAFVLLIILIYYGVTAISEKLNNRGFRYICKDENPCTECGIAVSCPVIQEVDDKDFIYFTIENRDDKRGLCYVDILIKDSENTISKISYKVGILKPNKKAVKKVEVKFPEGDSNFDVVPYCETI